MSMLHIAADLLVLLFGATVIFLGWRAPSPTQPVQPVRQYEDAYAYLSRAQVRLAGFMHHGWSSLRDVEGTRERADFLALNSVNNDIGLAIECLRDAQLSVNPIQAPNENEGGRDGDQ